MRTWMPCKQLCDAVGGRGAAGGGAKSAMAAFKQMDGTNNPGGSSVARPK